MLSACVLLTKENSLYEQGGLKEPFFFRDRDDDITTFFRFMSRVLRSPVLFLLRFFHSCIFTFAFSFNLTKLFLLWFF